MSDEATGGDVGVGDLIVELKGDGESLAVNLEQSIKFMDLLGAASDRLDSHMASLAMHADQIAKVGVNAKAAAGAVGTYDLKEPLANNRLDREDVRPYELVTTQLEEQLGVMDEQIASRVRMEQAERRIRAELAGRLRDEREIVRQEQLLVQEEERFAEGLEELQAQASAAPAGPMREQGGEEDGGGGGGPPEGNGGPHMGHHLARRLAGHAGMAVGQAGLGNEVTMAMMLVEAFGPAGAIVLGVLKVAEGLKGIYDRTVAIREQTSAWSSELSEAAQSWVGIAHSQSDGGAAGKVFYDQAVKAQDAWMKLGEEQDKVFDDARTLTGKWTTGLSVGIEQILNGFSSAEETSWGKQEQLADEKLQQMEDTAQRLFHLHEKELAEDATFNSRQRQLATESSEIAAMREGPQRQRLQLENELSQQREKLVRDLEEKDRIAKEAYRRFDEDNERAYQEALKSDHPEKAQRIAEIGFTAADTFANDNSARKREGRGQIDAFDQQADNKRLALQREEDERIRVLVNQSIEAGISLNARGYAREIALLKEHGAEKLELMELQGQSEQAINLQNQINKKEVESSEWDHAFQIQRNQFALTDATITAESTGYAREIALLKEHGAQKIAEMYQQGETAQAISLQNQINQKQLEAAERDHAYELVRIQFQLNDAVLSLASTGYARQMSLLKEHNEQKLREMEMAGQDEQAINLQRQVNQKQVDEAEKQHARTIEELQFDMALKLASATRSMPESQIAWARQAEHLTYDLSLTKAQLDEIHAAFERLSQAEANKGPSDSIRELNVELLLAKHQITELEANMIKLRLANPDASAHLLREQAILENLVKQTAFAHEQLASLHPMIGVQDYARQLKDAVDAGALSMSDATQLINKKLGETFGHQDAGTFNSKFDARQVDVRHLNLNPQNPEQNVADKLLSNGRFLESMDTKMNDMKTIAAGVSKLASQIPLS